MSLKENQSESASGSRKNSGDELERRYWPAMAAYAILALAAWFIVGEGKFSVGGRLVEIRLLPVVVMALMAFRTWVARSADRIRRAR